MFSFHLHNNCFYLMSQFQLFYSTFFSLYLWNVRENQEQVSHFLHCKPVTIFYSKQSINIRTYNNKYMLTFQSYKSQSVYSRKRGPLMSPKILGVLHNENCQKWTPTPCQTGYPQPNKPHNPLAHHTPPTHRSAWHIWPFLPWKSTCMAQLAITPLQNPTLPEPRHIWNCSLHL